MNFSDVLGWSGFCVILFSYFQVAMRRWRVSSFPNQLGNFVGSCLLSANSFFYEAWAPFALNIIWGIIALSCLLQPSKLRRGT